MSRRDAENYPRPPELTPWGFPASFYAATLNQVRPADAHAPPAPPPEEALARFRAKHADYLREHIEDDPPYATTANWKEDYRYIPYHLLADTFTFEELLWIRWNDPIMSRISEEVSNNPSLMLFNKIQNSMWHWGWANDWNLYVAAYDGIHRFDFGVPGFEAYIDHASWSNEFGLTQWSRLFCDGALSFNVVHRGELVLRIGYSVGRDGVFLTQVQLNKKRGNRWLYRLPCHYFEYCVRRVAAAFPGSKLWLVDGGSMADHVRRCYSNAPPEQQPHEATLARIRDAYDTPLARFERVRSEGTIVKQRRTFHLLEPVN